MNKKKAMIAIVLILVLVIGCGSYAIIQNYYLGASIYSAAFGLENQSLVLAYGIARTQESLEAAEGDEEKFTSAWMSDAVGRVRSNFGQDDLPILNETRSGYSAWIQRFLTMIANDGRVWRAFNDEDESLLIDNFKNQLYFLSNSCKEFRENDEQMSDWERCFTSWEDVREELSEKVKVPEGLMPLDKTVTMAEKYEATCIAPGPCPAAKSIRDFDGESLRRRGISLVSIPLHPPLYCGSQDRQ